LSTGAVFLGKLIGDRLADKAELIGGIVLVGIGLKILIESFL
jgi:putative Mn2+ efflux pump MntP